MFIKISEIETKTYELITPESYYKNGHGVYLRFHSDEWYKLFTFGKDLELASPSHTRHLEKTYQEYKKGKL